MRLYEGIVSVLPDVVRNSESAQAAMLEIDFINTVMRMIMPWNMRVSSCDWGNPGMLKPS